MNIRLDLIIEPLDLRRLLLQKHAIRVQYPRHLEPRGRPAIQSQEVLVFEVFSSERRGSYSS